MGKMAKTGKTRSYLWLALKSVVAGSVVVSRTFAAPTPVVPDHVGLVDDWRSLGQQMGNDSSSLPNLDPSIVDMISASDFTQNLTVVVLASYEMVDRSELSALDMHWASILTASGNAALVAEFLNLRSDLGRNIGNENGGEADAILWLAGNHTSDGCDGNCNNGWGNGSDCAPGGSLDENNGENYQGGPGQDPDGTQGGKSNSAGGNR